MPFCLVDSAVGATAHSWSHLQLGASNDRHTRRPRRLCDCRVSTRALQRHACKPSTDGGHAVGTDSAYDGCRGL